MCTLSKSKIIIPIVILQGFFSNNSICQFSHIYRPDIGGYYASYWYARMAFADKMAGFCSLNINLSPSSGSIYEIYKTEDGGETWARKINAGGYDIGGIMIFAVNSETCFAEYHTIFTNYLTRLSDEENYFYEYFELSGIQPIEMTKLNDSVFYLIGFHNQYPNYDSSYLFRVEGDSVRELYKTGWDSLQMLKAVFTDHETGFVMTRIASTQEYIIRRTADAGITWETCFFGDTLTISDIAFFNHSTGVISCSNGPMFRTDDAGSTWIDISLGLPYKINSLSLVNEDVGYGGGDGGIFVETLDRGQNWNIIPFTETITKLHMIDSGFGYITTDQDNWESFYRYDSHEGTENIPVDSKINIYPNPTKGNISIESKNGNSIAIEFKIINHFGKVIKSVYNVPSTYQIDLSEYPSGIYFLRINDSEHFYTKKIIKL